MTARIVRPRRVIDDIAAIAIAINEDNPQAADRFLAEVEHTVDTIARMPLIGHAYVSDQPQLAGVRMLAVRNFRNYLIFYKSVADTVELLLVVHGARDIPAVFERLPPEEQ